MYNWLVLSILCGLAHRNSAFLDSLYFQLDNNCEDANSFVCRNSKCVPFSKRCDGHADCLDSSDEEDCELFFCKEPNFFKCQNEKCIFTSFLCDQENDCGDFSDERNCTEFQAALMHPSNCSMDEWQCADRLCIPKDFVCNGEPDCLDGTDETMGCTIDLDCDGFKCKNGHCVPMEWKCDGNDDCHDNSDEMECQSQIRPEDCRLDKKLFLCANNLTCVNLTNVCDKVPQCPDKSDENGKCSGPETCATHFCSHTCVQLPSGPKCLCPAGYAAVDDKTCQDINECEIYGICDQKCKNTPGSYECYCDEKYVLQEDKQTCLASGGEAMMLYSSKTEIRGYFLRSELLFPVASKLKEVLGVSFDGFHVYWTDIHAEQESIVRSLEDGSERELLVTSGLGTPEDLAVDWVTGNIYFTDSEMQHIGVCNNNGTRCTVLHNQDINKPRGIVLHPQEGDMFWTDWGKKPEIARSKMDGTKDISFVSNNIRWPNGLAIDYPNERLYWTDGKLETLESIRLDGTDRRIILEGIVKHPYAIAVFENRLYWSDWTTRSIQSCDKFSGKNHHTLIKEKKEYIYGLHVFHSSLKPRLYNPCSSSYCSDICLISGPRTYSCACPQDKVLSMDKHTCKEIAKKQILIAGIRDMLYKIEHQILGKHEVSALPVVAKNIGALAFSPLNNTVYISDIDDKKLVSFNMNSGYLEQIVTGNIGKITSIDYDPLGNNLYWCDSEKKTIEVLSLTTMSRKILMHDMGGETPMSLALIPDESVMFVAMKKSTGDAVHIDRMSMDGKSRTHVAESGLLGPVTLHYDAGLHSVFWADAGTGNIEHTRADGTTRHTFKALKSTPVSITTLNKDLFWTNHNSRKIYWAPKDNSLELNKKITLVVPENTENIHLLSIMPALSPYHACQKNNGNCSHICLVSNKTPLCACPMGMALSHTDSQTCIKRQECTSDEFYCDKSDTCIHKTLRCNNHKDCLLGEDEEECVFKKQCPSSYFQCGTGDCIRNNLVCDLHFDCPDKSDEIHCSDKNAKRCPSNHFKCMDDSCIHERFVCDGIKDCSDGGDEFNCLATTCASNQFRCLTGVCIPKNWECDKDYDCSDYSDEHAGCLLRTCDSNQFTCSNGNCVDSDLKCNTIDDCGDSSDEANCKVDSSDCTPYEFQCTSDTTICVPAKARCNGTSECPHHEDEQGCSDCHVDDFECSNKKCVPMHFVCDGMNDCGDFSDEVNCRNEKVPRENVDVPCEGGFRCKSGACIDFNLLCNGVENCYDGSDEHGACNSSCQGNLNPCDHKCVATPSGPMCQCHEGYELTGDGRSCRDIQECNRDPPICSQLCSEKIGGFSCDCYDGYLIRSDKLSCKSLGEPMSIFYTINNEIRKLTQGSLTILHKEITPKITGLDVSVSNNYIYFSIEEFGTIHRINLKNYTKEFIKDVGKPRQIAVDWITDNIYYVNTESTEKTIIVCSFSDYHCARVIDIDVHSQVSSLSVDAYNKYIFYSLASWWVYNSPHTVLYKTNLDGSKSHELVKSASGYITGITFDPYAKLLYYVDQHFGNIFRLNYDGSEKSVIVSNITKASGLDFFEDHLHYLTNYGFVGKCRLYGDSRECDLLKLSPYPVDLFVLAQESKQRKGSNICASHNCHHVCVPSDVGPRCLCESGKITDEGVDCMSNEIPEVVNRRPTFGNRNYSQEEQDSSSFTAAVISIILVVLIAIAAYFIIKRRRTGKFHVSMRFQNPAFGLSGDQNESATAMLQPDKHEYTNPIEVNHRDFHAATNAILEKATPLVRFEE